MAISLASIQKGGTRQAADQQAAVIHGSPGIGKTTFGASAPTPGLSFALKMVLGTLTCRRLSRSGDNRIRTWLKPLTALFSMTQSHGYQTLVIDSLSCS
jgi:hypothetical protein